MPQSYSGDLRERVIGTVEAGASRREAADVFEISLSSAIRWVRRWREEGSSEPKPRGGSRSALEDYAERILALVAEHPDWTLEEILAAMHKQRIPGSGRGSRFRTSLDKWVIPTSLSYYLRSLAGYLAVVALALIGPVALLAANLLAAWPGQRAARLHSAQILRAE